MVQKRYNIPKKHKSVVHDPDFLIFTKKELIWIIIFIVIGSFISFIPIIPNDNPTKILTTILVFTIIIFTNITAKKLIAKNYAIKIEHQDWKLIRWGYYERSYFKKPFPLGIIAPFFLAIFSLGYLKPFTFFQFDAENLPAARLLKSHGQRRAQRKEGISEEDLAYTAATGFYALLALAIIGFLLKPYLPEFGFDLAKYSLYYGAWNLLPIGQLDGSKLFFGATLGWIFIFILHLISLLALFIYF